MIFLCVLGWLKIKELSMSITDYKPEYTQVESITHI